MINPMIYITCEKYEFLSFLIFNSYPVPKTNYKFEGITVNFQGNTASYLWRRLTCYFVLNFKTRPALKLSIFILYVLLGWRIS